MMQQTSLYAYYQLKSDPIEFGTKQEIVYNEIERIGPATDKQIAGSLNFQINSVTPRRGELVKMGIIEKKGIFFNEKTNRPETLWGVLE